MAEEEVIEIDMAQLKKLKAYLLFFTFICHLYCHHVTSQIPTLMPTCTLHFPHTSHTLTQVPELRAKLGEWGLETKGNKTELLARVDAYLKEQGELVGVVYGCSM